MVQKAALLIFSRHTNSSQRGLQRSKLLFRAFRRVASDKCQYSWINDLPDHLKKQGFSIIAADQHREPEWHRTTMTHVLCGVADELARCLYDVIGGSDEGDRVRAIVNGAREENLRGSYGTIPFQVVVAQKST